MSTIIVVSYLQITGTQTGLLEDGVLTGSYVVDTVRYIIAIS